VNAAELSSVADALDTLTNRIVAGAEQNKAAGRDDVAAELYEVERDLRSGSRRLARLRREL
jgi:hypothetical protein